MMKVSLYGKPSSRYEYLKMLLQEQLSKANLKVSINEINDVDTFIRDKVHSIPAIRFDDRWTFECAQNQDIKEFTDEVLHKMVTVKTLNSRILVPVDFSKASENAINFALDLAKKCSCDLELVHVYHPSPVQVDGQVWVNPEGEKPFQKRLDEWFQRYSEGYHGVRISKNFVFGFPVDELVTLSKSEEVQAIVMGTTGASDDLKRIFGSVSQELGRRAHCPVFAIPPDGQFSFRKVLYATDDPVLDVPAIKMINGLMEPDSELKIVHVNQPDTEKSRDQWLKDIPVVFPDLKRYTVESVIDESVADGILKTANEDESTLIAVATKHRSFWSGLFHKSTTIDLLTQLGKYPLLIFHHRG